MKRTLTASIALCAMMAPAILTRAETPARDPESRATSEAEGRMIEALGIALARALDSTAIRQTFHEALATSPFVEDRVALKRLLGTSPELRRDLLAFSDLTVPWKSMVRHLPELELYFPIRAHRAAWTGETAPWVAVPLDEDGLYQAFSADGTTHTFAGTSPPAIPTLLLARAEVDFDDSAVAMKNGARTGAFLRRSSVDVPSKGSGSTPCMTPSEAGPFIVKGSGVDNSRHTYLTFFRINDDHDPFGGSMEIDVFGSVDGSYSGCQRYSGINEGVSYYLPAPGASGSDKIAFAVPTGTNTVDVKVYEDDDTACVIKSSDDYLGVSNIQISQYNTIWGTSNGKASVRVGTQNTCCGDGTCNGDESFFNCCGDCASCGDGFCQAICGETGSTCSADCFTCGDGICEESKGENSFDCPEDCETCGNGECEPREGENNANCPQDCCPNGQIFC